MNNELRYQVLIPAVIVKQIIKERIDIATSDSMIDLANLWFLGNTQTYEDNPVIINRIEDVLKFEGKYALCIFGKEVVDMYDLKLTNESGVEYSVDENTLIPLIETSLDEEIDITPTFKNIENTPFKDLEVVSFLKEDIVNNNVFVFPGTVRVDEDKVLETTIDNKRVLYRLTDKFIIYHVERQQVEIDAAEKVLPGVIGSENSLDSALENAQL